MELAAIIAMSLIASIIGAVPLGLVNLTVLEVSYKNGVSDAMKLAGGASMVEIMFVLIAILAGKYITIAMDDVEWVKWLFVLVPFLIGIYFFQRRNHFEASSPKKTNNYFRGVILNLISIQVLLYWIFAITYLYRSKHFINEVFTISVIIISVWIGKMIVLWAYALLSKTVLEKFSFLSARINQVIGFILIAIGIVQYLKF